MSHTYRHPSKYTRTHARPRPTHPLTGAQARTHLHSSCTWSTQFFTVLVMVVSDLDSPTFSDVDSCSTAYVGPTLAANTAGATFSSRSRNWHLIWQGGRQLHFNGKSACLEVVVIGIKLFRARTKGINCWHKTAKDWKQIKCLAFHLAKFWNQPPWRWVWAARRRYAEPGGRRRQWRQRGAGSGRRSRARTRAWRHTFLPPYGSSYMTALKRWM